MIDLIAALGGAAWAGWKARRYAEVVREYRRQKRNERLLRAYEEVQRGRLGPGGGAYRELTQNAALKLEALHVEVIKHVCECRDCQSLLSRHEARHRTHNTGPDNSRRNTTPGRRLPKYGGPL